MSAGSKKAVVIGGAGFLGQRLVALIAGDVDGSLAADWPAFDHVHVLDRAPFVEPEATRAARTRTGVKLTSGRGDVCSPEDVAAAVEGAHTVFHLASIVHVGLDPDPRIDEVNVEGTRTVVRACQARGVPRLVYTSSEDVVLRSTPIAHGDETIPYPTEVIHDYVRTKIEGEKIALTADGEAGLRTCSIRPVHLYGPHDPHAIEVSLNELASGKLPFLLGDGSARFDIVYVDNVAHAHLLAAKRLEDEATRDRVGGQAYFIGEGNAPNYFEFIRPYAEVHGIALPKRRLPYLPLSIVARGMELAHRLFGVDVPFHRFHLYILAHDFFFSNEKAARDLGYAPIVTSEEGQRRTLEWVKTLDPRPHPSRA
jgi:nucleoside-diphosphate-sugar epimerase